MFQSQRRDVRIPFRVLAGVGACLGLAAVVSMFYLSVHDSLGWLAMSGAAVPFTLWMGRTAATGNGAWPRL